MAATRNQDTKVPWPFVMLFDAVMKGPDDVAATAVAAFCGNIMALWRMLPQAAALGCKRRLTFAALVARCDADDPAHHGTGSFLWFLCSLSDSMCFKRALATFPALDLERPVLGKRALQCALEGWLPADCAKYTKLLLEAGARVYEADVQEARRLGMHDIAHAMQEAVLWDTGNRRAWIAACVALACTNR